LQLAFLKAGVANVEAPSDHGIFACIYNTALSRKIRYVVSGVNYATETWAPLGERAKDVFSCGYGYGDLVHLKALHRRFSQVPLRTFPCMGFFRRLYLQQSGRIHRFDPLNYVQYNKAEAIATLQRELGWRPYQGKHGESVITRFHQAYILPVKFKVDKRRVHLSGLIWSGQLSRAEALLELERPCLSPDLLRQDKEYVAKKLGLSNAEFDALVAAPAHTYNEYPNVHWLYKFYGKHGRLFGLLRVLRLLVR
jgi:hypothetical protein